MTANVRIALAVTAASIALLGLGGCGPSAGEIRFAKAQQYDADLPEMTEVAKQAGGSSYDVEPLDKPDCPNVAWSECVWRFAAKPAGGGAETTAVVELHRSGMRNIMVEVDARDGTQKQADLLLYRIFELAQKYIPKRLSH
jgi:hypothetical protein